MGEAASVHSHAGEAQHLVPKPMPRGRQRDSMLETHANLISGSLVESDEAQVADGESSQVLVDLDVGSVQSFQAVSNHDFWNLGEFGLE